MSTDGLSFEAWLDKARLRGKRLSNQQRAVLEAAFRFLEKGGHDYASRRFVEHFLLHAGVGLKVAQVARLVNVNRCTSSRHRPCTSSQVVEAIHNRQAGKFPGKLLPRYAGPIAQFLLEHPTANRDAVLAFLERRWQIRPGYRALDNFLHKYGLAPRPWAAPAATVTPVREQGKSATAVSTPLPALRVIPPAPRSLVQPPPGAFFLPTPSTLARS
jgi:hypothetical protein